MSQPPKEPSVEPTRVLLAEDHTIVREGLRALLDAQPGIEVVGEATDGLEVVALARDRAPDVVVMDLALPGQSGVEATRAIRSACEGTRVLVLSMHASEEYVRPAVRAGASGYLLKGSGLSDLVAAIESVAAGNAFFSPEVARLLAEPPSPPDTPVLTSREREVLILVANGGTSPQIAAALGISTKTVENHRARIMQKLDIHDVAGLVRYAIRHGWIRA